MLIGYIGVPGSGKTTIASDIFTDFKKSGITTELIVEQARIHIAKKRYDNKLSPTDPLYLTDEDQQEIIYQQSLVEKYMLASCPKTTAIISDSSTINSFLYMTKSTRDEIMPRLLPAYLKRYDLLFYCHPVENFNLPEDSNRVHTEDSIKFLQSQIDEILDVIKGLDGTKLFELAGTLEDRIALASSTILSKKLQIVETLPE